MGGIMRAVPLALALAVVLAFHSLAQDAPREKASPLPAWVGGVERQFDSEQSERIGILIEFQVPPLSGPARDPAAGAPAGPLDAARSAIKAARSSIKDRLDTLGLEVLLEYDYTPIVLVNVRRADLAKLAALDGVVTVSPNLISTAKADVTTSSQAPEIEKPQLSQSTDAVGARQAWELGFDGTNQVIAVLDNGIYASHEMFQTGGSIVLEACFSGSSNYQSLCPDAVREVKGLAGAASQCSGANNLCQHGTHVAGIAAGYTTPWVAGSLNTANTHLGVAPKASLLPIQVFSRRVSGCTGGGTCLVSVASDELAALNYLIDVVNQGLLPSPKKLAVVTMSSGGTPDYGDYCFSDPRAGAIRTLRQLGVLTTISAGDESGSGRIDAPACIKDAIAVGATGHDNSAAATYTNSSFMVDILAAGGTSASPILSAGTTAATAYAGLYGTSMAAPHVAGAIAILKQKRPAATADELEWALKRGAPAARSYTQDAQRWLTRILDIDTALTYIGQAPFLGVPIAGYLPRTYTTGFNYARIYNPGASAGTVNITLVRDDTAQVLGTVTQDVPAHAAIQVQMETVQAALGTTASAVPATATLSAYFNASFMGYAQNILWNAGANSLTNITSCNDAQPDANTMLGNVHTALLNANYPSSIRIHNKGFAATAATFDIYNAGTGALLGTWTTDVIQPRTTRTYSALTAFGAINFTPDASTFHANFILKTIPNFVIGHVVNNIGAALFTDMTPKCRI